MTNSPSIPSDEALMAQLWVRFKTDDRKAFDQLVKARYRLLSHYATRYTKDRDLIKDCVQDLFLELWHRRKAIADTPCVTIYLIKSLRNNLLRKLRREMYWRSATEEGIETASALSDNFTVENEWIAVETLSSTEQRIRRAVSQLSKRQQQVIFLKFYEGLSSDAIAQVMEVEKQTVANFLYRAMTQLRSFLPARIPS